MIFTSWKDVKEWIEDNGLVKYNIKMSRSNDGTRSNDFIFTYNGDHTPEENLRLLEKRLSAHAGTTLYGVGWRTPNTNVGGSACEICYPEHGMYAQMQQMAGGVAGTQSVDRDELERTITEKITARFESEKLKEERKRFEDDKKEFESQKNSAIGAIVQLFGPMVKQAMGVTQMADVAGAPAGNVPAERIVPVDNAPEEEQENKEGELPDEEAAEAYSLLVRLRKVEPDYLRLLQSVVTMAENGDSMYSMAKGFLIK